MIQPIYADYTSSPAVDPTNREFGQKKLSDTIMFDILLRLDDVEIKGNSKAMKERGASIKEVSAILDDLAHDSGLGRP
jgi:hypothetical protein